MASCGFLIIVHIYSFLIACFPFKCFLRARVISIAAPIMGNHGQGSFLVHSILLINKQKNQGGMEAGEGGGDAWGGGEWWGINANNCT